jgi:MFS family permease
MTMANGLEAAIAAPDDRRAKRNAIVLSVAQALFNVNVSTIINVGGVVGGAMLLDKSHATLPLTTMAIGSMLSTVPASLFMQRYGRRAGLQLGAVFGLVGSFLAAYAVYHGMFALFCFATALNGAYQASAQYYRFAAADTASVGFKPRAISWVLAGGLVAALFVPAIIGASKDLTLPFVGCFMAAGLACLIGLVVLQLIDIPTPPPPGLAGTGRPLTEIAMQPRFIAAAVAGMIAYGMMTLAMTATPLAILGCGFSIDDSTSTIRWHVLAMFAPSFFTGDLIARFGKVPIVLTGMALLAVSGLTALAGTSLWHFDIGLILLGLGWNFGFIGATALVTDCHRPEERGKVQALNDLIVFSFVALTSYLSGALFAGFGWASVNMLLLALVAVGTAVLILAGRQTATAVSLPQ